MMRDERDPLEDAVDGIVDSWVFGMSWLVWVKSGKKWRRLLALLGGR